MKKRLLLLGAGFMQGVAMRCAKERGWEVVAVDGNPRAVCVPLADRFSPIDLKDRDALVRFALDLKAEGGLDAVFTAATDFSASVACVAEACGLPGHSLEAALNASDKVRMRGCFKRAGVPSPEFVGVDAGSAGRALSLLAAAGIDFPVVVKPADNMGARGCRRVDTAAELGLSITDAIRYSRTGTAIVEQFMDGPEFSLEALVFDGQVHMTGFADRHIRFSPYFIEMGHTIPTALPERDQRALIEAFTAGIRALGLSFGVAKGDIKLTSRGPMIGEIAGRLSGGYMSGWTFPYSSGIDLTGAALDLASGMRPRRIEPEQNWTSAERAWISIPGRIASVSGLERARTIPYMRDVFPRQAPGDDVDFPRNNVEKCGNCLAAAPERDLAVRAAEEACRCVFVRLEPRNPRTDAFLSGSPASGGFPPDAFPLPAGAASSPFVPVAGLPVPGECVPYLDTATDWQGRTLRQSLARAIEIEPEIAGVLGKSAGAEARTFWKALLRGGIQGIVYAYDCTIPN